MDIMEIAADINAARDEVIEAMKRLQAFAPTLFGAVNSAHDADDEITVRIVRIGMDVYREAFETVNLETIATRDVFDDAWKAQANRAEVLGNVKWIRKPRESSTATVKVTAMDLLKAELAALLADDVDSDEDSLDD